MGIRLVDHGLLPSSSTLPPDKRMAGSAYPRPVRIRSSARTDVGRHRRANEDAFFRDDTLRLFVVADGMGGHAAGEVASSEAVDTVFGMVKRGLAQAGMDLDQTKACR